MASPQIRTTGTTYARTGQGPHLSRMRRITRVSRLWLLASHEPPSSLTAFVVASVARAAAAQALAAAPPPAVPSAATGLHDAGEVGRRPAEYPVSAFREKALTAPKCPRIWAE
jgi:hypothetical protein